MNPLSASSFATHSAKAFSLIEVSVALGVVAFCLTALLGLIPAGLSLNRSSRDQCAAADVAALLISDLKSTPRAASGFSQTGSAPVVDGLSIPSAGQPAVSQQTLYYTAASGTNHFSSSGSGSADYRLSVSILPPAAVGQLVATSLHIRVSWPAQAMPGEARGAFEVFTAMDSN